METSSFICLYCWWWYKPTAASSPSGLDLGIKVLNLRFVRFDVFENIFLFWWVSSFVPFVSTETAGTQKNRSRGGSKNYEVYSCRRNQTTWNSPTETVFLLFLHPIMKLQKVRLWPSLWLTATVTEPDVHVFTLWGKKNRRKPTQCTEWTCELHTERLAGEPADCVATALTAAALCHASLLQTNQMAVFSSGGGIYLDALCDCIH